MTDDKWPPVFIPKHQRPVPYKPRAQSKGNAMTTPSPPPAGELPEPAHWQRHEDATGTEVGPPTPWYSADQMRAALSSQSARREPDAWMTPDGLDVMTPDEKGAMAQSKCEEDAGYAQRHDVPLFRAARRESEDTRDAERYRWIMANCIVEDMEGWANVKFATNRMYDKHDEKLAEWIGRDIDAARGTGSAG